MTCDGRTMTDAVHLDDVQWNVGQMIFHENVQVYLTDALIDPCKSTKFYHPTEMIYFKY